MRRRAGPDGGKLLFWISKSDSQGQGPVAPAAESFDRGPSPDTNSSIDKSLPSSNNVVIRTRFPKRISLATPETWTAAPRTASSRCAWQVVNNARSLPDASWENGRDETSKIALTESPERRSQSLRSGGLDGGSLMLRLEVRRLIVFRASFNEPSGSVVWLASQFVLSAWIGQYGWERNDTVPDSWFSSTLSCASSATLTTFKTSAMFGTCALHLLQRAIESSVHEHKVSPQTK